MYSIYADSTKIYDDTLGDEYRQIINPTLSLEDSTAGTLSMTLPPGSLGYDLIRRMSTTITVRKEDVEIWWGRVISESVDFWNQRNLECEGALTFLNDVLQPQAALKKRTVAQYIEHIITNYNAQADEGRKFAVGEITAGGSETKDYDIDYTNTLECLNEVTGDNNGHIRVRKEDGVYILDYLKDYPGTSSQTVEFGKNLLDFTRQWSNEELATVIVPLGIKLDSSRYENMDEKLTVASVNGGSIYVVSEAAAEYGRCEKVVDFGDISSASKLLELANTYLADAQYDETEIELDGLDLHYLDASYESIDLLDIITVTSAPHGMHHDYPVRKMEIPLDSPENTKFTLGLDPKKKFTKYVKEKEKETASSFKSYDYSLSSLDNKVSSNFNDINGIKSDYQKASTLNSSIGSYLGSNAGRSAIGNYVSSEEGKVKLTQTLSDTYLQVGEVKAKFDAYVTGDGHAQIVQSLSSTYQPKTAMSAYVLQNDLNTKINQYIDSSSGKAQIVQSVSGTYQTKSAMDDYTKTVQLNTHIGQYIDTQAGTAKIVQSVSGTYMKLSAMGDYYTRAESVAKMEQVVKEGYASWEIVADNGEESSKIKLVNGTATISATDIFLKGMVTLNSLSVAGKTVINGSNITTGTISLSRIDTSGLTISATNKDDVSTLTLKSGSTTLSSADVQIKGMVTFSDLKYNTNTVINGSYITTGTISADRINTTALKVQKIYGLGDWYNHTVLSSNGGDIYIGGTGYTAQFPRMYITASQSIYIGDSSTSFDGIVIDIRNKRVKVNGLVLGSSTSYVSAAYITNGYFSGIRTGTNSYALSITDRIVPNTTVSSSYSYFDIGSSSYPMNHIYCREIRTTSLYVNGIEIKGGSTPTPTATVYRLYPGGSSSSSNYIEYDSNRAFYPAGYGNYASLGKSTAYWQYAYIGSNTIQIGNGTSSKIGFYGTTAVSKQTVSTSASLTMLITALQRLGLV